MRLKPVGRTPVVTGSTNQIAYLMDLNAEDPVSSTRMLRGHHGSVWSLTFSGDSRWLVTGDEEGTVRLWDLNLQSLLVRARRATARELTAEEKKLYMLEGQ
jgi:WD40 repeat protein